VGFRGHGVKLDVEVAASVREAFWTALRSGQSPTAAATVAGVSGATGRRWAKAGGYQRNPQHCGTRYVGQVREVFWAAVGAGMSPAQAAVVAGVSENAGREWITQAGYVLRTPVPAVHTLDAVGPSLSFTERCRLEQLLESRSSPARGGATIGAASGDD